MLPSQTKRPLNTQFIARGLIVALGLVALTLVIISQLPPPILSYLALGITALQPVPATPPPPTLTAPRGALPAGPVGLTEWRQYAGGVPERMGSGFLLRVSDTAVIGVTTAHSLGGLGQTSRPVERVLFSLPGQSNPLITFDALYGPPGVPCTTPNLAVDFVLLQIDLPPGLDPNLTLQPDPRGAPQPGERVTLFSGLGDDHSGPRPLAGTVLSVDPTAIWVLMDETFNPGQMSGSPLLSQHTGQVVGMTIVVTPRRDRILLGFHPIASLMQKAEAAAEFVKLADFRR